MKKFIRIAYFILYSIILKLILFYIIYNNKQILFIFYLYQADHSANFKIVVLRVLRSTTGTWAGVGTTFTLF